MQYNEKRSQLERNLSNSSNRTEWNQILVALCSLQEPQDFQVYSMNIDNFQLLINFPDKCLLHHFCLLLFSIYRILKNAKNTNPFILIQNFCFFITAIVIFARIPPVVNYSYSQAAEECIRLQHLLLHAQYFMWHVSTVNVLPLFVVFVAFAKYFEIA